MNHEPNVPVATVDSGMCLSASSMAGVESVRRRTISGNHVSESVETNVARTLRVLSVWYSRREP